MEASSQSALRHSYSPVGFCKTADGLWIQVCTACKEGLCKLSALFSVPVQVVCEVIRGSPVVGGASRADKSPLQRNDTEQEEEEGDL